MPPAVIVAFSYIEPACAPRYRVELIALTGVKDKIVENVIISTSNNARAGKPIFLRFILFMLRHRCRINEVLVVRAPVSIGIGAFVGC